MPAAVLAQLEQEGEHVLRHRGGAVGGDVRHRDATGANVNGKHVPYVPRSTLRAGVTVDLTRGWAANASYAAVGRTDARRSGTIVQRVRQLGGRGVMTDTARR
jgi:hypothetical protein